LIKWWNTKFGEEEIESIARSIRDGNVSQGSVTREFESQLESYLNVGHVVATSSGTSALTLALLTVGVGPGDEVIVPNRTWISTAHAATLLGAKVVITDVEKERPVMDYQMAESLITSRTKAIIPVHLNGRAVDINKIRDVIGSRDIAIIEDAAQALGSRTNNQLLGTLGDIGCFSFSVAKSLATGQGGIAVTDNSDLAARLRALRTHGIEHIKEPGVWVMPGSNFRFTDIAASIGMVQLGKLDDRLTKAVTVYERFRDAFAPIEGIAEIPIALENGEVPIYNEFLFEEREKLVNHLKNQGIDTRLSYPNLDKARYLSRAIDFYPNSEKYSTSGLILPSGPAQSDEDIECVIRSIMKFLNHRD
jgi:dTDP-4-amino-4,6-dideoxygalactose transaminase